MNTVTSFVRDVAERAVKTAAQAALLTFGSERLDVFHADWKLTAGMAGGGFVLSVLTSLASQPFGNPTSASVLGGEKPAPVVSEVSDL